MELDRTQWYVRWFFWSLDIWDDFRETNDTWRVESRGTNLCHFMRVTLVWAPLVLLLHLVVYGSAIAALTVVPVVLFGFTFYGSLIAAILLIIGTVWGTKKYRAYQRAKPLPEATPTVPAVASGEGPAYQRPKGPGFFSTLWKYIVATKQKVCPMVTFRQPEGSTK